MNTNEQIMNTALLAGEIMIRSGAEAYRVEDTMSHILQNSNADRKEVVVMMTGMVVTLINKGEPPLTMARRVSNCGVDLTKVVQVNDVSRKLCNGELNFEEAYQILTEIQNGDLREYKHPMYYILVNIGAAIGFTMMFGGKAQELIAAAIAGVGLAFVSHVGGKIGMNKFIVETLAAMATTVLAILAKAFIFVDMNVDVVIVGPIMPLVPGFAFTNAVRDIFQGNYLTGGSRMLEAFIHAAVIALGVGIGMAMFGSKFLGRTVL